MNSSEMFPDRRKARIEIIPLIDVIFFLLATFVLFTMAMEKIGAIEVQLPSVPPPPPPGYVPPPMLYIQASSENTFYWKESLEAEPEMISAAEIRGRLEDYAARNRAPRVFVRGDRKAKFGATVMVLDEVRRAGIKQVSVETLVSPTGQ